MVDLPRNETGDKNMKLKWNDADITQFIENLTWSGSAKQTARTIEFNMASNPYDTSITMPNIKLGDIIKFYDDSGKNKFVGRVSKRERKGEAGNVAYTANDYMIYLLRSKATYKFKKKKAETIVRRVCKDLKIKTGNIAKTGVTISKMFMNEKEYYNIIMAAYTKAKKKTHKQYMARMNGTKLEVIEKGKVISNFVLSQDDRITESSYEETTDSMINKVVIYNNKNKKIGTISNSKWTKSYGIFQDALSVDKGTGKKEAKGILTGVEKTASVSATGDIRCISGAGIKIEDKATGLTGTFWIESDTHTWENGNYMMTLELAFKNVMDEQEADEESKSSKTVSTGILNGKKVKAKFTAYYPANNKMEGGKQAANGEKLNPSKYTCAAPKSIKFGKQIQVLSTGTSRDKKVHKVNDRGGAIKVVNGVYHFDLLFATKAQCNKFGVRKGYAIIGDGTGYKTKAAKSGKADKVIDKAKSYKGKVKYVFGAASPQSGKSDCSGFTQYIFKKAAGINIGRTTGEQVKKGKKVTKSKLKPGDLVMFKNTYNSGYAYGVSHVGIFLGSGKFIHCSSSKGVTISKLTDSYYTKHFLMGRRIL